MSAPVVVVDLDPALGAEAPAWLGPAVRVGVEAIGDKALTTDAEHWSQVWDSDRSRPGFRAVGAVVPADAAIVDALGHDLASALLVSLPAHAGQGPVEGLLIGIAMGYSGSPEHPQHQVLAQGLEAQGRLRQLPPAYFDASELHVVPALQGDRVGERLALRLLEGPTEPVVVCFTFQPADDEPQGRALTLYRDLGFMPLLYDCMASPTGRPLLFLSAPLPVDRQAVRSAQPR